jgi:predicted SAM-dependent methyltransferase
MKIIVGAALTSQPGWYSTNEQWLDITSEQDWQKIFRGKQLLTHVVAEHVFEHLTQDEAIRALHSIYRHMRPDGRVRIAVPDGFHPAKEYIRHVGVNGIGADASDHKQLLTMDALVSLIQEAGFIAEPLEGYSADGSLLQKNYDPEDGLIYRSRANPENIAERNGWGFVDANTSLIVDGVK